MYLFFHSFPYAFNLGNKCFFLFALLCFFIIKSLLFYVFIKSRKAKIGILFGLLMGCYLTAIDLTVLSAFNSASENITFSMIPVNIIIGIITGWILTMIYREKS